MKPRLVRFLVLALALMFSAVPQTVWAQSITLRPNQVPNGIAVQDSQRYHQRFDITLGGSAVQRVHSVTITIPSQISYITSSITVTSSTAGVTPFLNGAIASNQLAFGITGTSVANAKVTIEFNVTTPNLWSGISEGGKQDTSYLFDFVTGTNMSDLNIRVSKHQNRRVQVISFTGPDSLQGDTTTAGGRFYKLTFPSTLPDFIHTNISGLKLPVNGDADATSDVLYSFYISTDSTLVKRPLGLQPLGFLSLMDAPPLAGSRQRPRVVPATFIRESFTTTFADSIEGVVSLEETEDNQVYYVYVGADPAPTRHYYNPFGTANLFGRTFLGRSGPILVQHPPEFVVVGWDYDTDNNDDFSSTGVIQVPSDIVNMDHDDVNRKDNRNLTVDTGTFFAKGATLASFNSGKVPSPVSTADLLYVAQDVDNPQDFQMNIFLSTQSGLGVSDLVGAGIDSLSGSIRLVNSDTLTINDHVFTFNPIVRNTVTNLIDSFIPEASYFVYFAATDGTNRTVSQVFDDPFDPDGSSAAQLTVRHSPILTPDAFALNDYDASLDGDLDVVTGIDISQMQTDPDGKNLGTGPAKRFVNISWGVSGIDGDLDVDDNATIDLYYSTLGLFRAVGKSDAYTNGNSTGADLLDRISRGDNDTHLITSGLQEDDDAQFDNQYAWDLWSFVSPEGTVPRTDVRYYIYAIMKGGTTQRLVSMTETNVTSPGGNSLAVQFQHPPYIRPTEPARDITVTVDEPVQIRWDAVDVDNAGTAGAAAPANGLSAPNSRTASPNIRILLTSADFGEVTTWASIVNTTNIHRFWVGNSGDGSLSEELELNENVDTSFVIVGNRMRNTLFNSVTNTSITSADLELQTNNGLGKTYYVYLAIDSGFGNAGVNVANQPSNFSGYSPLVRAPGRITFTGTVPTNPPTSVRFVIPTRQTVVERQDFKYAISADDGSKSGRRMEVIDIFMTLPAAYFEAVDTDPSTAGVQPFTLGQNSQLDASKVQQIAFIDGDNLRLDFIYDDNNSTGLTYFDGQQPLAFANLRVKPLSGGSTVNTTITLDNSGSRQTKMLDDNLANAGAFVPNPTTVTISRRAQVSGTVPLQGRSTSADTVTFMLRRVGEAASLADSLFNLNDIDDTKFGVQVLTTGVNGDYTLSNMPEGIYVLSASVPRHLTGHDTLKVVPGVDQFVVQPTLDGDGADRTHLLAGDAAGYTDSTGTSLPDNFIDSADINAINAALFSDLGDADYNTFADINRDSTVNATDKDYATVNQTSNTGTAGDIKPVFPTFKRALPEGNNAEAILRLANLPEGEVRAGETFDVTIDVSGARAVRTYEVHLAYDPTKLTVDEVVDGTLFQNYLTDMGGRAEDGDFGLVTSIIGQTPVGASGEGSLVTVRFRAIGRAAETRLALSNATLIDVEHAGATPQVSGEAMIVLSKDAIVYHDADGQEIRSLIQAEADPKVDFNDFLILAKNFGSKSGDADFDLRADLNADDSVDFADFLIFTSEFGKVAVDAPSSRRASKPAMPGVNRDAGMSLKVDGEARMGQPVTLVADLSHLQAVQGWGLTLRFDPDQYAFVEARAPESGLLNASGSEAPLFLVHQDGPGQVSIASAISAGEAASGAGSVAQMVFRPLGEFEQSRFEVAGGVVFDPADLSNPLGALEVLEVKQVPSEFALAQNYPNPFNPETTIAYDLAEGGYVRMDVFNVMGQLVNTLVSEDQPAGRYRLHWEGLDAQGRQVASGVYFYRLQASSFQAVRKLMLLK